MLPRKSFERRKQILILTRWNQDIGLRTIFFLNLPSLCRFNHLPQIFFFPLILVFPVGSSTRESPDYAAGKLNAQTFASDFIASGSYALATAWRQRTQSLPRFKHIGRVWQRLVLEAKFNLKY